MKQKLPSCFLLLLIVFLLGSSHVFARLLSGKQGESVELKDAPFGDSVLKIEKNDSLNNLMGLEDCENGDQECLTRRFLADAHLDYIYTQQHKP